MTVEILHAVISRLLKANGYSDHKKYRKMLVKRYLEMDPSVPETKDEILLWKILNTSEDITPYV